MEKLYSQFTVKSIDEEQRIIKGIASTPSTDRDNDIVESRNAKFSLPYPLLAGHDHASPIGEVIASRSTSRGLEITAKIAKDTGLDYVEKAWLQVKSKLVRGLSIGFRGLKTAPLPNGGVHFKQIDIHELSVVVIPANTESSIESIKHFCNTSCRKKSADFDERKANVIKRAEAYLADHHKPKDA